MMLAIVLALALQAVPGFDGVEQLKHKSGKLIDGAFLVTSGVLFSATAWDLHSTFSAFDRCSSCYEANPIFRPFAEMGRGQLIGAQVVMNAGVLGIALAAKSEFRHHPNWLVRHLWVVPTLLGTVVHIRAAVHNGRIPGDCAR